MKRWYVALPLFVCIVFAVAALYAPHQWTPMSSFGRVNDPRGRWEAGIFVPWETEGLIVGVVPAPPWPGRGFVMRYREGPTKDGGYSIKRRWAGEYWRIGPLHFARIAPDKR